MNGLCLLNLLGCNTNQVYGLELDKARAKALFACVRKAHDPICMNKKTLCSFPSGVICAKGFPHVDIL